MTTNTRNFTADKPVILQAEIDLILIKFAIHSRIATLTTTIIERSTQTYKKISELEEYDLQMKLGIELAADIRNYNLQQHYSLSNQIFTDLHMLLDNQKINWPLSYKKQYEVTLARHEGVLNDLETQLVSMHDLLDSVLTSNTEFDVEEQEKVLTNIVGICLCQKNPANLRIAIQGLDRFRSSNFKAVNNYYLGRYLLETETVESGCIVIIDSFLQTILP